MSTQRTRRVARISLVALAASAMLLTGCTAAGPGGDDGSDPAADAAAAVFDKYAAMSGQERHDALVAEAQDEGVVSFYTTNSNVDDIVEGFEDMYGIEVQTYRASSDTMVQRLLQEQEAGFFGADVVEDADAGIVVREGYAAEYVNPELTDQIADFANAGGIIPTRQSVYVVSWNTDLVDGSEIPADLADFADPKWAGRLSIEASDWAWYMQVNKVWKDEGKSDQEIADIWKGIASNSVVASGHTFQGELLGAGEFDIALGLYTRTVDRDSKDGVPVAYRRPDNSTVGPNVYIYDGAALLKRAPHPAASLLLIDYLLTEGQKVLADSGWPTAIPQDDRIAGIELVQIDPEEYFGNAAKWQKEYEAVIAGHEVIGG